MPWVMRDATTNAIIGEAALESLTFSESVAITDPAYIAYLLAGKKTDKLKQLKGKRTETIGGCVEYTISSTAHKFQVDAVSYSLISNALSIKERGNITYFPIVWIDADNIDVTITDTEFAAIFDRAGGLYEASYANYSTHRTAINDATDQTALDAVDITSGWPTTPYTGV